MYFIYCYLRKFCYGAARTLLYTYICSKTTWFSDILIRNMCGKLRWTTCTSMSQRSLPAVFNIVGKIVFRQFKKCKKYMYEYQKLGEKARVTSLYLHQNGYVNKVRLSCIRKMILILIGN